MASQGTNVAVVAGVVTTAAVGAAVAEGVVLSIESVFLAVATGVLAGLGVGAVVLLVAAGDQVRPGKRHVAIGAGLFAWIALALFLVVSSVGVENEMALLAGVAVGAVVGIGVYVYIRDQDSRRVQAVTMR